MRERNEIEEDTRDGNIPTDGLILEVMLDMRDILLESRELIRQIRLK